MSGISEGDQVVTPEGEVCEVYQPTENFVLVKAGLNKERYRDCDVVKVSEPIRIKVSHQCYAESLVALAEECGFERKVSSDLSMDDVEGVGQCLITLTPYSGGKTTGPPGEKTWRFTRLSEGQVLTYAQGLPQIEAWLQANAESEDEECERCGYGHETVVGAHTMDPCPECGRSLINKDCSDESEDYGEPQPEDEEWLEDLKQSVCGGLSGNDKERLGFYGMTIEDIVLTLAEHIDDLESEIQSIKELCNEYGLPENEPDGSCNEVKLTEFIRSQFQELQDVREERDFWEKKSESWKDGYGRQTELAKERFDKIKRLQERIEEARRYIKRLHSKYDGTVGGLVDPSSIYESICTCFSNLEEILSPDSDEGDGE